jgi:hypothetical protein
LGDKAAPSFYVHSICSFFINSEWLRLFWCSLGVHSPPSLLAGAPRPMLILSLSKDNPKGTEIVHMKRFM